MPLPDKFLQNVSMEVSVVVKWSLPIVCWMCVEAREVFFGKHEQA